MSRSQLAQRQRTQDNPLNLGTFSQTSLRCLRGTLGPQNKVVGYRDTRQNSNGGFGGGTCNHWFKVTTTINSWLILIKGEPRPNYIEVSVFDLNQNPIQGLSIFQKDSLSTVDPNTNTVYYPFWGHVMASQSVDANIFERLKTANVDNRYFSLHPGDYLICISTTRNENLDYTVGLVIEAGDVSGLYLQESQQRNFLTLENNDLLAFDATENYTGQDDHQHSLSEWQDAWSREHQDTDRFPDLFIPYTTTS